MEKRKFRARAWVMPSSQRTQPLTLDSLLPETHPTWHWWTHQQKLWSYFKCNNYTWNMEQLVQGQNMLSSSVLIHKTALWRVYSNRLHIWRVWGIIPKEQVEHRVRVLGDFSFLEDKLPQYQEALIPDSQGHQCSQGLRRAPRLH